ncbi:uncharacterized protein [Apostichopus japonicus]|uniref:uncharacterized protein isoform X2 n=1 Tax=Stichopus japonicus TaxID=307972 RepID=UPI003AB76E00
MEIYEAKCAYKQVADSVLTFEIGEKFYVLGRPNDKWWFAKRIVDNLFGYVPAAYLQPTREKVIGKLVPNQRRGSREHDIHLQALAEIHKKVKPLPAHVIEQALGMEPKPRTTSAKSPGSENPPRFHPAPHREAMSPPPSWSSPQARPMRHSHSSSRERPKVEPRRVKSVRERPTFLSESFPTPDYSTSHRRHSPQTEDNHFQYSTNNNLVKTPWSAQASRGSRGSPPPLTEADLSSPDYPGSCSVLASRKMITIEDEEDLPDHLQNLPSPPLLSPPPPDYDLDEETFTANGKPYHHQMNISTAHPEGERIPIPDEDDEANLIKPKPLVNPVIQSKEMMNLHRELKQSGRKVLDKPELKKVFRDRQIAGKKKEAEKWQESRRTSMEIKLMERQELLEKEENRQQMAKDGISESEEEALKPEFAKLKLRQTNTTKT